ncbi:MAG: DinB family protein [Bacteroidetes bacterium]|nr:DinB family protein [Bacteroidota bacterium]
MKELGAQLKKIIDDYSAMMREIEEKDFTQKPNPKKWSKKEILGHTIDSAQNNIRRFIVAQYENRPIIKYNQDQWVAISNYQISPANDLIELWILLNRQICNILNTTSPDAASRTCITDSEREHTIAFLAEDYIKHLRHHLHQVLDLEAVPYP